MKRARKVEQPQEPPQTVDAYLRPLPEAVRGRMQRIRSHIRKALPAATESISYRIPTYKLDGRPLLYFAAFKAHIGLYPMTDEVKEAFADELAGYPQSKGTVRFPHDRPVPFALIARIAKLRANSIRAASAAPSRAKAANKPALAKGPKR